MTQTRTARLAAYFLTRPGQFVSAFTVQRFSPLGRTQEVSRVRSQFGMDVRFEKRGRKRGYVFYPKVTKAA